MALSARRNDPCPGHGFEAGEARVAHGRTRMIVLPVCRSVGLKAETASSRVEMLPMFVRSRPSRKALDLLIAKVGGLSRDLPRRRIFAPLCQTLLLATVPRQIIPLLGGVG